jgi:hypothetical protein
MFNLLGHRLTGFFWEVLSFYRDIRSTMVSQAEVSLKLCRSQRRMGEVAVETCALISRGIRAG